MKEDYDYDESFDVFDDEDDEYLIDQALFKIGEKVAYKPSFGAGPQREATIIDIDTEDGEIVYDLDNDTWCYETQVIGLA